MQKISATKMKTAVASLTRGVLTMLQVINDEEKSIVEANGREIDTLKKVNIKTKDNQVVTGRVTKTGPGYIEILMDMNNKKRRINPRMIMHVEEAEDES